MRFGCKTDNHLLLNSTIASILRRCVSPQADRRPSPLALIRAIKKAAVVNHGDHGTTNTGIKTRRRVAAGGRRKR